MDERQRIEYLISVFEHELEVNAEGEDQENVLKQEIHNLQTSLFLLNNKIGGE